MENLPVEGESSVMRTLVDVDEEEHVDYEAAPENLPIQVPMILLLRL